VNFIKKAAIWLSVLAVAVLAAIPATVYADTDGSELQITDQPDKLIIQLGVEWAGVEFELKTDAGVFPIPVTVDATGILTMDLGGSKTYILSCLTSNAPAPNPGQPPETTPPQTEPPGANGEIPPAASGGIPAGPIVLFIVGLAAAVGGLMAMRYFKNRRESNEYDEDDDEY
jgi:hypothetical protein